MRHIRYEPAWPPRAIGLYGLPGTGKSTIADQLSIALKPYLRRNKATDGSMVTRVEYDKRHLAKRGEDPNTRSRENDEANKKKHSKELVAFAKKWRAERGKDVVIKESLKVGRPTLVSGARYLDFLKLRQQRALLIQVTAPALVCERRFGKKEYWQRRNTQFDGYFNHLTPHLVFANNAIRANPRDPQTKRILKRRVRRLAKGIIAEIKAHRPY